VHDAVHIDPDATVNVHGGVRDAMAAVSSSASARHALSLKRALVDAFGV
jgi:hypothetical protein